MENENDSMPTYLIVFKQPIAAPHDENGDRMYIAAQCIEEAIGLALIENPDRTYNDVLDTMEI